MDDRSSLAGGTADTSVRGHLPRRVIVVGNTGSGKTTLARRIAALTGARHVELDGLYHEANWTEATPEVFRQRVRDAVFGSESWVTDGGYASFVWDIKWIAADDFVWLDYPFPLTFRRMVWRTFRRWATKETLWNGNRESLTKQLFTRDSLFLFAIQHRNKYRHKYPPYFDKLELAQLRILRLRSPHDTERYVASLAATRRSGTVC